MKAKLENKLQTLLQEAGYDTICDNRSPYTKSVNIALQNPMVDFKLIKKGFVATQKNGFKWNLRIRIAGIGKVFNIKEMQPATIADAFAVVAKMEPRERVHSYI